MADQLRLARLYWILLAIFTIGRWAMSLKHVPYDRGNPVFSLVTLTFLCAVIFAAFIRRWRGYGLLDAVILGAILGLSAQIVIFTSTAVSYLLGLETYFNHPIALNATAPQEMSAALKTRAGGLVGGPIFVAIAAAIGWVLGAVLPEKRNA
jgi:hypothetical protein